jgi:ribokinase
VLTNAHEHTTIAVVGSTMMDMTCYADILPISGETLRGNLFTTGFGGKGANQAVMAARCGSQVFMVGSVGKDLFGDSIRSNLQNSHVNTNYLKTTNTATGVAHIWVDTAGENRILIIPGANLEIDENEAIEAISAIPHLGIVIGQCEIRQEITLASFRAAKKRDALTILNPAPFEPLSDELLSLTDWLIPNEIEFAALNSVNLNLEDDESLSSFRNGKPTIVTLGADGALLIDQAGKVFRTPSPRVEAIDSTGAGDCFIGAFAAGLSLSLLPTKAMQFGCACASKSVSERGAQSSYPSEKFVQELLKDL